MAIEQGSAPAFSRKTAISLMVRDLVGAHVGIAANRRWTQGVHGLAGAARDAHRPTGRMFRPHCRWSAGLPRRGLGGGDPVVDGVFFGLAGDDFFDVGQFVAVVGQEPQVVLAVVGVAAPPGVFGGFGLCMTEHCSCPRRSGGTPCVSDGRPVNECWCVECPSAAVLSRCAAGERGCLLQLVPASGPRRGVIGSAARCWARLCRAHIDSPIG